MYPVSLLSTISSLITDDVAGIDGILTYVWVKSTNKNKPQIHSLKILKPEDIFANASKGAAVKEDGKLLDGTLLQADGLGGEPGKTGDENGKAPTATTKQRGE